MEPTRRGVGPCLDNTELKLYPDLEVDRLFHAQRCFKCLMMVEEMRKDADSFSRRQTQAFLPAIKV